MIKCKKKNTITKDVEMGPKHPRSTVLTLEEEIIVKFRKHTLLSLIAAEFLRNLIKILPYKIHTVLDRQRYTIYQPEAP